MKNGCIVLRESKLVVFEDHGWRVTIWDCLYNDVCCQAESCEHNSRYTSFFGRSYAGLFCRHNQLEFHFPSVFEGHHSWGMNRSSFSGFINDMIINKIVLFLNLCGGICEFKWIDSKLFFISKLFVTIFFNHDGSCPYSDTFRHPSSRQDNIIQESTWFRCLILFIRTIKACLQLNKSFIFLKDVMFNISIVLVGQIRSQK